MRLKQQLDEAEKKARLAQKRSDEEIRKLKENLEKAHEELRNRAQSQCVIL